MYDYLSEISRMCKIFGTVMSNLLAGRWFNGLMDSGLASVIGSYLSETPVKAESELEA